MVTYTSEEKPVRKYSAREILSMEPERLRKELKHLMAKEPDMAGKVEVTLGYELDWHDMTTYVYFLVALCWAKLEDPEETEEMLGNMNIAGRIGEILSN